MTYSAEQYLLNKERIKAAQKRYYLKTRETRIAKQREYDDKHRDQINAQKRKLYAAKRQIELKQQETELNNNIELN